MGLGMGYKVLPSGWLLVGLGMGYRVLPPGCLGGC